MPGKLGLQPERQALAIACGLELIHGDYVLAYALTAARAVAAAQSSGTYYPLP